MKARQRQRADRFRMTASLLLLMILAAPPVFAATDPATVPRPALLGLARQFVDKMEAGFQRADESLMSPAEKRRQRYKVDIPDGEMLLLKVRLNKTGERNKKRGITFTEPVLAIKQGDDVLVSLTDLFNVAQFAIEVKPAQKVAEGWYVKKNQLFRLDANSLTATANGAQFKFAEGDIEVQETDILVKSKVLEQLFDFESYVVLAGQFMDIESDQKWPPLEKLERLRRLGRHYLPPPSLPEMESPYKLADVPNVHITTTRSFKRDGSGEIGRSSGYRAEADGDFLNHTARLLTAGSMDPDKKKVDTASLIFKRESDIPDLLGKIGARKYEFGDLGSGVGARITNRDPYVTADAMVTIEGEIPLGWDVELYRGSQYLGNVTNSENGLYRFEDVPLNVGTNAFKVVKYGPLGEIEEEELSYLSTPDFEGFDSGTYNLSVAAAATNLWARNPQESQDKYTPVIDGSYQWRLADNATIKTGLSTSQKQGEQKTFPSVDIAAYLGKTVLNTSLTADLDGALAGGVTARRAVLGQNVSLGANYTTEDFGSVSGLETPSKFGLSGSVRGPISQIHGSYALNSNYSEDSNGNTRQKNEANVSSRIGRIGVSTGLEQTIRGHNGKTSETITGATSLSGRLERINWHAVADYNIAPDGFTMNSYSLNLQRGLAPNLSGILELQNNPGTDATSGAASLVWNGKYARVVPSITYDSANNFTAKLNSSFGLSYNSYGNDLIMRSKDITKFGGVSAFVFLDKNGDNIFNNDDEPLQDAIIEAPHARDNATTDEKGEAFLFHLPSNTITDVRLNEYSFFDPLYVPGNPGVSIRPRAGHEARIEFPVHRGGEMDGSVFIQMDRGKARSLRNVHLMLYDMDGRLAHTATTSFDGFYLFQKIHPGNYYLVVDEKDAKNFGFVRPLPEIIAFGYEGTVIYGRDIKLDKANPDGPGDIPLNMGADYKDYVDSNPSFNPAALEGKAIVLNLGSYHSNLLTTLMWYKIRSHYNSIVGDAVLLVNPAESYASAETGLHTLRVRIPGFDIEEARHRCRALIARGLYCGVEVMPQLERKEAAAADGGKG